MFGSRNIKDNMRQKHKSRRETFFTLIMVIVILFVYCLFLYAISSSVLDFEMYVKLMMSAILMNVREASSSQLSQFAAK